MEILLTLLIFTASYGLVFLSLFPEKSIRRINEFSDSTEKTIKGKYDLTWPYFLSFLGGYVVAAVIVYLIWDHI
ncbi:hypothetical protein [Pleomorphovibrio marinus]|uniref:hypothetical protein n=1 Tax=Pleomorphovibrio marinus TaxID=2164132 RepID=UPI000E0A30F7|nr:hypothetical protein [Pleomorphovibrio marinus]